MLLGLTQSLWATQLPADLFIFILWGKLFSASCLFIRPLIFHVSAFGRSVSLCGVRRLYTEQVDARGGEGRGAEG